MPQLEKGKGQGWHGDQERHSRARKFGNAGGTYRTIETTRAQKGKKKKKKKNLRFKAVTPENLSNMTEGHLKVRIARLTRINREFNKKADESSLYSKQRTHYMQRAIAARKQRSLAIKAYHQKGKEKYKPSTVPRKTKQRVETWKRMREDLKTTPEGSNEQFYLLRGMDEIQIDVEKQGYDFHKLL